MDLIILGIVFCSGLFVGWNLFPQPKAVKDFYDKLFQKKE